MNAESQHIKNVETVACEAIDFGICVHVTYDGLERVGEVHTVGVTKRGKPAMRLYQVEGADRGWKLMTLQKVEAIRFEHRQSLAPRDEYAYNDTGMSSIIKQIETSPPV